jgi:hypothetical protein
MTSGRLVGLEEEEEGEKDKKKKKNGSQQAFDIDTVLLVEVREELCVLQDECGLVRVRLEAELEEVPRDLRRLVQVELQQG